MIRHPDFLDLQGGRVLTPRTLGMNDPIATGSGQHLVLDLVLGTHTGAEDVLPSPLRLLQLGQRLLADHAPISDDADALNLKTLLKTIHDRNQGLDIRRVAGPQFTTDRPPFAIEHRPHHQLLQVRAVILAVTMLPQALTAVTLEVEGR